MKFDFKSALMGACLVFGLFGLNAFKAPTRECLTQEQQDILALFSLTPGYIDDCDSGSYPTLRLTGVNLQIVNGLGTTSSLDGTGNLIVGYLNYHCGGGSHNVIVGANDLVSSYSSLVVGDNHTASAQRTVVFGNGNTVSGPDSTVLGGANNTNAGASAAIVGGNTNEITAGDAGVIGGGYDRAISGNYDWQAGSLFEDD